MSFIIILLKVYVAALILRYVMTQQELNFNHMGRLIAKATNPVLNAGGKLKSESDRLIPVCILVAGFLIGLMLFVVEGYPLTRALISGYQSLLVFLVQFSICSIVLGSLVSHQNSSFLVYFYRIGNIWVKAARKIVNVSGNKIVIPAVILVLVAFITVNALLVLALSVVSGGVIVITAVVEASLIAFIVAIRGILSFYIFVLVARALMSWVSPSPSNPIVQIIYGLTEPVLAPLRRRIPPIGMFDLSSLVAIFGLWVLIELCGRLIAFIYHG